MSNFSYLEKNINKSKLLSKKTFTKVFTRFTQRRTDGPEFFDEKTTKQASS